MSKSINTVVVSGNLGVNPETKQFPSGASVTEFTIALSDYYKPKDGEAREQTYWIRCKCWGVRGESLAKYFSKGMPILVTGKLTQEEWMDKEDKKQTKTLVNVEDWFFMGGDKKEGAPDKAKSDLPKQTAKAPKEDTVPY